MLERRPSRKQALILMTLAGRDGDHRLRVRLLVESRINKPALHTAWAKGEAMRGTKTERNGHEKDQ